jgi:large subunit ribosomal protein L21
MYAIIKTGGKQYKVAAGDVIQIEKLDGEQGQAVEFPALAVAADNEAIRAGRNTGARVTGVIVGAAQGEKIKVFKFKRKKHYKRLTGHRQHLTRVQINEIVV